MSKLKATITFIDKSTRIVIGEAGAMTDMEGNWWHMVVDQEPIFSVPRDNILYVEYEDIEEVGDDIPELDKNSEGFTVQ